MVNPDTQHASGGGAGGPDGSNETPDPFGVLGIPRRFDLDPAMIDSAWLRAAAACHPDRAGGDGGGGGEGGDLQEIAAVNAARATLADPEQRAEALLVGLGGASRERDNSMPDGFLMEIFSVRQEMEEARASGDAAEIARFERWAQKQRGRYIGAIGGMFASVGEPPERERLDAIRRTLNAWRYIERMIEQLAD